MKVSICRDEALKDNSGVDITDVAGPVISETLDSINFNKAAIHVIGTGMTSVVVQGTNFKNTGWNDIAELTDPTNNLFDIDFTAARYVRVLINGGTAVSARVVLEG